jgi:protein tyrosine phosphatase (PTP) superfamily phosphohydrolase (DUF442 family)
MLNFRVHGDDLGCCGQITIAQVPHQAALGCRTLICKRPDGEDGAARERD